MNERLSLEELFAIEERIIEAYARALNKMFPSTNDKKGSNDGQE